MATLSKKEVSAYDWRAEGVLDKIINGGINATAKAARSPRTTNADWGNLVELVAIPVTVANMKIGITEPITNGTKLKSTGIIINGKEYGPTDLKTKKEKEDALKKLMTSSTLQSLSWKGIPQKNGNGSDDVITVPITKIVKTEEFGGKTTAGPSPSTAQQEQVTLKLFEILLGVNGYNPTGKSDEQLLTDFRGYIESDLKQIWSGLALDPKTGVSKARTHTNADVRKWYWHFFLQFKKIRDTTQLPNNVFKIFHFDDFMDFITNTIIVPGPPLAFPGVGRQQPWKIFGRITQKDSWNPADIWLVNYKHPEYNNMKLALQEAKRIKQINAILINAYRGLPPHHPADRSATPKNVTNPIIVGISLKKSMGGSSPKTHEKIMAGGNPLHYDLVNLKFRGEVLPQIKFEGIEVSIPWDRTKKLFTNVTNTMTVKEVESDKFMGLMKMGSGGGGAQSNINLEYSRAPGASMLGKIPRDLLDELLTGTGRQIGVWPNSPGVPTWQQALASIPSAKDDGPSVFQKKITDWNNKLDKINEYVGAKGPTNAHLFQVKGGTDLLKVNGTASVTNPYKFVNYIIEARKTRDWDRNPARYKSILQITQLIQWYYILSMIFSIGRSRKNFDDFIENTYYIAQKRGQHFKRFGPFGKLY